MKLVHFAAMMIVALIVLAACAPTPTPVPPTATSVPPTKVPAVVSTNTPVPPATSSSAASAPAKPAALTVTNNATFGKIVTDANGMTLYMFPRDTREPSTSNCYDQCAKLWPALLTDASGKVDLKSSDLDAKLFGTTTRKDGTKQVTFNGWPLYYWLSDQKAGDTLGFGVNDIWWVMTPDGNAITAPVSVAIDLTLGAGRDGDQSGTARLIAKGDKTDVSITIKTGAAGVAQPAHIHVGQCPEPGAVKYPLTNVVDGKSTTTLDVKLADLLAGGLAINVHLSGTEASKYVACGALPQGTILKMEKGRDDDQNGTAVLVSQGAKTDVYLFVKPLPGVSQPAHIHDGVCPVPGGVKYPLTNVAEGKSKTTVEVALADLLKGGFAINVHKSAAEAAKYVACGNIKTAAQLAPSASVASGYDDYGYK